MPTIAEALATARRLHQAGDFLQAEQIYQQILHVDPRHVDTLHLFGVVNHQLGRHEQAVRFIGESLRYQPGFAQAHDNLGVVLRHLGRLEAAAACHRQAIHLEPLNAESHQHLGEVLEIMRQLDEAELTLQRAVALDPALAAAHCSLGNVSHLKGRYDEAISHYKQALQIAPNFAVAHNNIGNSLQTLDKFDESIPYYRHALRLDPAFSQAHHNLGRALAGLGRFDEALASYEKAIQIKPDYAEAHYHRSLVWLLLGDFERGLVEYEWRRRHSGFVLTIPDKPSWDGSPLSGKTLLVIAEQGLGDSFQFVRYLRLVKERFGGRILFWCYQPLIPLLEQSNLGVDGLIPWGAQIPEVDAQIPLASLPHFMGTTLQTVPKPIPYIHPRPDLVEQWGAELRAGGGETFRVGIGWQGNPQFVKDRSRSFPLKHFGALARVPGVQLYSLQKRVGSEQLQQLAGEFSVIDLAARLDEGTGAFMDTAAVMKNLDLVVTSDTSIAHLAGALGVPVWVALSHIPYWGWMLQRDDSPWYPSMRLFRQHQAGDWAELFDRIAAELKKTINKQSRNIRGTGGSPGLFLPSPLWGEHVSEHTMPTIAEALATARRLHQAGDFVQAEQIYQQILRVDRHQPEILNLLGLVSHQLGRNEQAIDYINEALGYQPALPAALDNRGIVLRQLGRLEEAVASYRQAIEVQPTFAGAHYHLGEILVLMGKMEAAEPPLQRAVALDPKIAEAHCVLGNLHHLTSRYDSAERYYRQALQLAPHYVKAHNDLGYTLQKQGKLDEAVAHYREAVRLDPHCTMAYANLGVVLVSLERLEEAESACRQGLRLHPDSAEILNSLGIAVAALGQADQALESYELAIRIKPDYADAHWNRSLAWLLRGDFEGGFREYEWRRQRPGIVVKAFNQPYWDGSPLDGRALLVTAEQGFGDSFQFVRYLRLVKERFEGRIFFWSQKPLVPLMEQSNLGIDAVIPWGVQPPEFAVQVSLLSLPHLLGTTMATVPTPIPYIHPRPDLVEQWGAELRSRDAFRIGIAWQGSATYTRDRSRSLPLQQFGALARVPGVQLYSLQKGVGSEQLQQLAGRFSVIDLAARLDEGTGAFMDTAAVMKNLDLVVTSDTSITHLAGALGVPVWVALSHIPEWRWLLQRDDSPWYPSMRLFRQHQAADWTELFDRIAAELKKTINKQFGVRSVSVEIAPGELLDKITILQIKSERITDEGKLQHVNAELVALRSAQLALPSSQDLDAMTLELRQVNEKLWDVEDEIRVCEAHEDFGPVFIELARSVYHENDRRALLKRKINELLGAAFIEQKSYTHYS